MKTVHKYGLKGVTIQTIFMPKGARILSCQVQHGNMEIWALVDQDQFSTEPRIIQVHGTGHPVLKSERLHFIDTVQMANGALVFHVFEELRTVRETLYRHLRDAIKKDPTILDGIREGLDDDDLVTL